MTYWAWLFRSALAILLAVSANGCLPGGHGQSDEEKELHYLEAKSLVNSMDYKGAIEEFEKALEVNPRSAAAHFQLALLYQEKEPDPAAAIYHFERFLKLRPDSDHVEFIKQRIANCKQDLAQTAFPVQASTAIQQQLENLAQENARLQEEVARWQAFYRTQTNQTAPVIHTNRVVSGVTSSGSVSDAGSRMTTNTAGHGEGQGVRTHVVQSGDTPFSIARRYGVTLERFMAANPGLDARRLRPGQKLNVPAP